MITIGATTPDPPGISGSAEPSDAHLPVATAAATRAELRDLVRHQWWRIFGIVVVMAAGAAAGLVVPATLGAIVDSAIAGDPPSVLWRLGGLMVAAAAAGGL
ncbi:MAG: ABC transporter ATP-binding protein, partial [Nakamurella sp.]